MKIIKQTLLWLLIFVLVSCIKDVDFDQVEDFALTPVASASVIYSNIDVSRFYDNDEELESESVTDAIRDITVFTDDVVLENLVKAELIFGSVNSINRSFDIQVDFLSESDETLHTFSFNTAPSVSGNDFITEHTELFENESLEALKATRHMRMTFNLHSSTDGSTLDENSTGRIVVKSRGNFYLNISL
ncbi:MAG: hypothetical protein HRT67_13830 [Flavobacteriaceae bacterium]|nr:hypothetical protein [Flavobacteriaceae bacterium]